MGKDERHALGAHYTNEIDILKIIKPSLIKPYLKRIEGATTLSSLIALRNELLEVRILDPACGAGNFYVAYREIKDRVAIARGDCEQIQGENR